jgi:hypothetical protein
MPEKWRAKVCFSGDAARPEWAGESHDYQKAVWNKKRAARVMSRKYVGTAHEIEAWVQWYREGPVSSVTVHDCWSEKR